MLSALRTAGGEGPEPAASGRAGGVDLGGKWVGLEGDREGSPALSVIRAVVHVLRLLDAPVGRWRWAYLECGHFTPLHPSGAWPAWELQGGLGFGSFDGYNVGKYTTSTSGWFCGD